MIRTLSTAATGLEAQAANIERISNDLSNVNTDGYKRGRTEFQELMVQTVKEPGAEIGSSSKSPTGIQYGTGVKVGSSHRIFEQGPTKITSNPFDALIEGKGFFRVVKPNGEVAYTRNGAFHKDSQGRVVLSNGCLLDPQINVPANAVSFEFRSNGEIAVHTSDNVEQVLGQIPLVSFINESGLKAVGGGLYLPTPASGQPTQGIPGENSLGTIMGGALEASNVDAAKSMVDMIQTQRAYEMNTKIMNVADQMYKATIDIK